MQPVVSRALALAFARFARDTAGGELERTRLASAMRDGGAEARSPRPLVECARRTARARAPAHSRAPPSPRAAAPVARARARTSATRSQPPP